MKYLGLVLLASLIGCSASVQAPARGWFISSSINEQAVCFRKEEGISFWNRCSSLSGEDKTSCQVNSLLRGDGEIFSNRTEVSVYTHFYNGKSKVLIRQGWHEGETFYCPTIRVRK